MNIVMLLTDQMHKYAVGYEQSFIKTPNIDKLAKEGCIFRNSYSNNPVCGPYRANLFTGMYSSDSKVYHNCEPLPENIISMADAFNRSGYETSFVGKWHLGGKGNCPIPEHLRGGFKHFIGYQCYNGFLDDVFFYDENNTEHRYNKHRTDVTTDLAIERLEELAHTDNPFLHVVFYQAPHYPVQPSQEYEDLYKNVDMPYPINYEATLPFTPTGSPRSPRPVENDPNYQRYGTDMEKYKHLYYGMVSQIDNGIGRIIEAIHNLNLADDTAIIFSADHGDLQGSHGLINKNYPYEESCGVPLVIYVPGQKGHNEIKAPVSCIDLYPTCLDLAGIDVNRSFEGESLLPLILNDSGIKSKPVFAENYHCHETDWVMIRTEQYKLSVKSDHSEPWLMFDMINDPYEMKNLVHDNSYKEVLSNLMEQLKSWSDNRVKPPLL
ncbi:sulfatase-like hydrolase/transferase [Vallitalea guaymasensis]|uniref:sulfatase-like hydrolase/transferase n=1 Tax=Vallitalea guaymasensis TaxID=1185412 RepID=UPI0023546454|nr:sulfatase-like hydrolase/transferase [Vallitalea guaymasensis]